MINVAIIVLHFGDVQETILCLASLRKLSNKIKHTIFVVDNGTKQISKNELEKILPNVKLIKNKKNLGFSEGNNVAITKILKTNFSHILLLNNDTLVKKNLLKKLLYLFNDPTVGVGGCTITYEKNKTIWFNGGNLNKLFCFTRHKDMGKNISILSGKVKETDFITGATMMIKRDVFEKIGLLPKEYFLYWEDVDFCYAAKQKKFSIKLLEEPLVIHKVSAASGIKGTNTLSPLKAYYYARNPFVFIKKFQRPVFWGILGQFAAFVFYIRNTQNIRAATLYIKGFIEGLKILFT